MPQVWNEDLRRTLTGSLPDVKRPPVSISGCLFLCQKTQCQKVSKSKSFSCKANSVFLNKINGWGTRARTSISGVRVIIALSIVNDISMLSGAFLTRCQNSLNPFSFAHFTGGISNKVLPDVSIDFIGGFNR